MISHLLLAAFASIAAAPAPGEVQLDEIKAGAERYKDLKAALADGYTTDGECVSSDMMGKPGEGGMGVHYFRPDLLGITAPPNPRVNGTGTHTDFRKPSILIYEPQADGTMQLVAVENLVFEKAWKEAGNNAPPVFHGVPYDHMVDDPATAIDEAHMFEPHYDRHVWIFRDNPKGVFHPFNPNVTCAHTKKAHHEHK